MKIIVDTNILIDFSRKKKTQKEKILYPQLVAFAKKEGHQLILPSIAVFELFAGAEMEDSLNQEKMENILNDLIILDLTYEVAQKAAGLFRKHQKDIGPIDYFLAATTMIVEGELATLNPRHFHFFKGLRLFDFSLLN